MPQQPDRLAAAIPGLYPTLRTSYRWGGRPLTDRLLHHVHIVPIAGKSYRLKHQRQAGIVQGTLLWPLLGIIASAFVVSCLAMNLRSALGGSVFAAYLLIRIIASPAPTIIGSNKSSGGGIPRSTIAACSARIARVLSLNARTISVS